MEDRMSFDDALQRNLVVRSELSEFDCHDYNDKSRKKNSADLDEVGGAG